MGWDLLTWLGVWGAIVSTILAGIKIWEAFRDRSRLTASYGFSTSAEYGGNEVILENPSRVPVMVSYWELLWIRRERLRRVTTYGRFPNEGYCNITIGPHSRHKLEFLGEEWFDTSKNHDDATAIWLKLYVVGGRPKWLKVYDLKKKK